MPLVTIHSRRSVANTGEGESGEPALEVRYSTEDFSPRTVVVPGESPTDEEIAAVIRQDLEERTREPPQTLEV